MLFTKFSSLMMSFKINMQLNISKGNLFTAVFKTTEITDIEFSSLLFIFSFGILQLTTNIY